MSDYVWDGTGQHVKAAVEKNFWATADEGLRKAKRRQLELRDQLLAEKGPCSECGEPADFRDGLCSVCARHINALRYERIPWRKAETRYGAP